jgi:hypothetical protein
MLDPLDHLAQEAAAADEVARVPQRRPLWVIVVAPVMNLMAIVFVLLALVPLSDAVLLFTDDAPAFAPFDPPLALLMSATFEDGITCVVFGRIGWAVSAGMAGFLLLLAILQNALYRRLLRKHRVRLL